MFNPMREQIGALADYTPKPIETSAFMKYFMPPQSQPQYNIPQQQNQQLAPLDQEVKNIADKNLKYSTKRGEGCTDCSAFTQDVFKNAYGVDIGGYTGSQRNAGRAVKPWEKRKGDLVFFDTGVGPQKGSGITHVGIDNGDGTFTHFSSTGGGGVKVSPYEGYFPTKEVRRVL
jgi:cell wall-associated NlpC family hydrolase